MPLYAVINLETGQYLSWANVTHGDWNRALWVYPDVLFGSPDYNREFAAAISPDLAFITFAAKMVGATHYTDLHGGVFPVSDAEGTLLRPETRALAQASIVLEKYCITINGRRLNFGAFDTVYEPMLRAPLGSVFGFSNNVGGTAEVIAALTDLGVLRSFPKAACNIDIRSYNPLDDTRCSMTWHGPLFVERMRVVQAEQDAAIAALVEQADIHVESGKLLVNGKRGSFSLFEWFFEEATQEDLYEMPRELREELDALKVMDQDGSSGPNYDRFEERVKAVIAAYYAAEQR